MDDMQSADAGAGLPASAELPAPGPPAAGPPAAGPPAAGTPAGDASGPEPAPRGEPAATLRDPRVLAALDRLGELDDLGVDDHVAVYDAVHHDLRDALADAVSRDADDPR
jgi:hypothetical protein